MDRDLIFEGLNPEQRRAVEAVSGPVAILAGAGSGKTTTITRRIANQVATGTFAAQQILAVTFTDKAAAEMRARLDALGVRGVRARTFHAAALQQLHRFGRAPAHVLPSKVLMLRHLANSLPKPYRFRPAADLATEIEWAKNRRLSPARYEDSAARMPPIPIDLMAKVYRRYEERKRERGLVDFEDLLEQTICMFDEDGAALVQLRDEVRAITVDEFQDVNLLQGTLLGRWLGDRDELCVVGDDHQAIYSFTGATPRYLLELPIRFPQATVVRLEENYRSTPQILGLANRLAPTLGGTEKVLRAVRPDGPEPELSECATAEAETAHVVSRVQALRAEGVPLHEIALLFRLNSRSEPWEEARGAAGIPFRVRGGAFLGRQAARRLRQVLGGSSSTAVAADVRAAALAEGFLEPVPAGLGEAEETRQDDLRRLVELAGELDDGDLTLTGFVAELERRFGGSDTSDGVNLLTYHRAKGLEFEAVFLPRLEEGELPVRQAKTDEAVAEERRLLYVGLTRAKRQLSLSWTARSKPSRFLAELGATSSTRRAPVEPDDPVYAELKRWRAERATADEKPAYVVFHNTTLAEIVRRGPRTLSELAAVPGVGPAKLERYGEEVLELLTR
ncbi:MAG: ATP-dependent DNA helicase UvrD2 [Actinobacteria bacterium]|nr:ATP-dependent DNA helicase UvrD2 [Actinomycetota bacterium]